MVKGVLTVEPITSNVETRIAYQRAHTEISTKIFDVLTGTKVRADYLT